jgi:hypothetical protein
VAAVEAMRVGLPGLSLLDPREFARVVPRLDDVRVDVLRLLLQHVQKVELPLPPPLRRRRDESCLGRLLAALVPARCGNERCVWWW